MRKRLGAIGVAVALFAGCAQAGALQKSCRRPFSGGSHDRALSGAGSTQGNRCCSPAATAS